MSLNKESELKFGAPPSHVKDIFGHPQKSILKLSNPIIMVLLFGAVNNIVDLIWVSGLGVDALSAVGFCIPMNMIALALSGGLGAGGGALISRSIGAKDKAGAASYAEHTLVLTALTALLFSGLMIVFAKPILALIGAGALADMAASYAVILFSGVIIYFFNDVASSILESEGNVKRVMWVISASVAANMILDPLFIYGLDLGIQGAAIAGLLAGFLANLVFFNWLFISPKTYVAMSFKNFQLRRKRVADILKLSLPVTVAGLSFSVLTLIMNIIVAQTGGTDGVAVFSTGMRIAFISLLPMMAIASAVTTLTGVAYGNHDFPKIRQINAVGVKTGLAVEGAIAAATFVFAPYMAGWFVWSDNAASIENDLIVFLRIMACVYLSAPLVRASTGAFIGSGKGQYAMAVALLRTVIVIPPVAYFLGKILDIGLAGIWVGLAAGNWIVALATFMWARIYFKGLSAKKGAGANCPSSRGSGF